MNTPLSHTQFARPVTVLVVGGGQAGLSAAYHLTQRGFVSATDSPSAPLTYLVLDAGTSAGGAWAHRWESLTMDTVNNIFDLPDFPQPPANPTEPSKVAVPAYFAAFEQEHQLAIQRPVRVLSVEAAKTAVGYLAKTTVGTWLAQGIINATGTWDNPIWPTYPHQELFTGKQLHTRDYTALEDFAGQRVGIVGGGISAVQHLEEISRVAETFWFTRRPPVFTDQPFSAEYGRQVIEKVTADIEAGKPTGSVVSYTGLTWSPYALAAKQRGVLKALPMFAAFTPTGVLTGEGQEIPLDTIIWATGFKPALTHLDPLGLRNERGIIQVTGTQVTGHPRIHLIGYGASQSTVGANRAGRTATRQLHRYLTKQS